MLPVPVFRHPDGVVITLLRSFSGLEIILSSIHFQIFAGSFCSIFFSSSDSCSRIAFLYFCKTSSSTLGFSTYGTKISASMFFSYGNANFRCSSRTWLIQSVLSFSVRTSRSFFLIEESPVSFSRNFRHSGLLRFLTFCSL